MSWDLIFQHLFIVLAASLLSIAVGLPLGIWAYVSKTARPVILRIVDLLQTIPSLALLGIIMVVLDPGKLTVITGITLYSLLPIVRNTCLGLQEVDPGVKEAARGMGMSKPYRVLMVEFPLAFPTVFTGIRIAVVNAMHNSLWSTYTVAATIPIAIIMGLYMQIWRKGDVLGASIIGVVLLALCILTGPYVAAHPETFGWLDIDKKPMSILIPVYGFAASVLPVWMLLLPRDYLSTFLKIGTIGALALGIVFVMPDFNMPAFTEFTKGGGPIVGGPVIPFIFITIACGALSGFHATIGTGTTPKMIGKERDVLFVGYGAMLVEGFVAIMALIAACVLVPADYFAINAPADKFAALGMSVVDLPTLEKEVAESLMHRPGGSVSLAVGMAHIFGQIPWMAHLMSYWYHFAIMFEAVFILTAVDAGTRVGRFFLQEMIGKVIPKFGDKNWWPGIVVTSFLFTGAWGYLVYTGDISSIWPLFGISNQLLASVTLLIGTTMLLRMNKTKYAWITAAPGIFMTFITFWAGIWLIMYQYIPTQKYLLASLSVLVMVMMGFVIIGTLRRWSVLLKETKIVRDPYGDEVKEIVQE